MNNTYKTISRAENFFSMLLTKANISDNLFIGNMPATIENSWKDMILVDVISVNEYNAYAKGSANVFLYAKSVDSRGTKPVKELYKMELALDKAIGTMSLKSTIGIRTTTKAETTTTMW